MKNIHFIGICGAGMAGIAVMLKNKGYGVSGSDEGFYDPIASYLRNNGFALEPGYRPENIPADTDAIVIGKHAKLVPETNAEVAYAFQMRDQGKVKILSFPEVLEQLTADRLRIVVAGSYGKSTTTALIAWCLESAKKDPGYFIGAQVYGMKDSCVLGTGPFVFEGDEYPSANWDNRSKFEFYHPQYVLLTSGEHDHVNVFKTHQSFLERFETLLGEIPDDGLCIGCIENDSVEHLLSFAKHPVTYGLEKGIWHARNIVWADQTTADVYKGDTFIVSIRTSLLGKHNMHNIIGAAALLLETKLLTPEEFAAGITGFVGVRRRLDRIDDNGLIPVYEGFGSSYAKARSAIEALQLHYPARKIYCVFEPHTFSWRDPGTAHWYDDVFKGVEDVLIVTPPAAHGKDAEGQLTPADMLQRIGDTTATKDSATVTAEALNKVGSFIAGNPDSYIILILTSGEALGLGPLLTAWSQSLHHA